VWIHETASRWVNAFQKRGVHWLSLRPFLDGMRTKSRFEPGLGADDWAKGRTNMCSGRIRSFWTPEGAR
jgi:hypothetical protein